MFYATSIAVIREMENSSDGKCMSRIFYATSSEMESSADDPESKLSDYVRLLYRKRH
jgi:hypothetical protein